MMMSNRRHIAIRINPDFNGPTLRQIGTFIDPKVTTDVLWNGDGEDHRALQGREEINLCLMVKDVQAMERAASSLGLGYSFPTSFQGEAKRLMTAPNGCMEWRKFISVQGIPVIRGALTQYIAGAMRDGFNPKKVGIPLAACWTGKLHLADVDVLVSLGAM